MLKRSAYRRRAVLQSCRRQTVVVGHFALNSEPTGSPRTVGDLEDAVMDLTRLAVDAGQFINRAVQVKIQLKL